MTALELTLAKTLCEFIADNTASGTVTGFTFGLAGDIVTVRHFDKTFDGQRHAAKMDNLYHSICRMAGTRLMAKYFSGEVKTTLIYEDGAFETSVEKDNAQKGILLRLDITGLKDPYLTGIGEFIDIIGPIIEPLLREETRSSIFLNGKRLSLERTTQQ